MSIFRCVITGIYYLQKVQNVINVFATDDTDSTPGLIAIDLRDHFVEEVRFMQNIGFQYQTITVQRKLPSTSIPVVLDISSKTGTLTGAGYHSSIALLWTLRTVDPTRKGRGRIYVGGVHGQTPLNGLVHPTALNTMSSIAATWVAYYGALGSGPYLWTVGPHSYSSAGDYRKIEQIVARPYFGIQRRRNIGVGG